jgi:hypothetical protein
MSPARISVQMWADVPPVCNEFVATHKSNFTGARLPVKQFVAMPQKQEDAGELSVLFSK